MKYKNKINTLTSSSKLVFQSGVTIIEAMIAMLVFSIGALGLIAMQYTTLAEGMDNQQRTLAIWKAQEFASRMKSNPGTPGAPTFQAYINAINNNVVGPGSDLGVNSPLAANGMVRCGVAPFVEPGVRCSDYVNASGAVVAGASCNAAQLIAFDIWDVFCEPSTGASPLAGTTNASVANGSAGLSQLQVFLRQAPLDADGDGVDDGNGDMELYFEWLSKASDAAKGISDTNELTGQAVSGKTLLTSLCSFNNDNPIDTRVSMDSRLDAYCMKFRI